ncbi:MAG: hypothetical protein U0401_05770 [Anaerolineae bacterium]
MEILLNTLLWLIVGSLVIGGLWLWRQPYPHNPLRGWILAAQILIATTIPTILLAVIHFKPGDLGFIALEGGVLFTALILLIWGSWQGGVYEQELRQMESGQALARWECTTAEYRHFLKSEQTRLRTDSQLFLRYSFIFAGAAVILFAFIFSFHMALAWTMGGIVLAGGLFISLIDYLRSSRVKAHYEADDLKAGDILFSPKGVLMFGRFIPLQGFNLWLEKVSYIGQAPSRLHFVSAYRRRNGGKGKIEVYIPVPSQYRAEAKSLVAKYREGNTQVSLTPTTASENE